MRRRLKSISKSKRNRIKQRSDKIKVERRARRDFDTPQIHDHPTSDGKPTTFYPKGLTHNPNTRRQ